MCLYDLQNISIKNQQPTLEQKCISPWTIFLRFYGEVGNIDQFLALSRWCRQIYILVTVSKSLLVAWLRENEPTMFTMDTGIDRATEVPSTTTVIDRAPSLTRPSILTRAADTGV